MKTYIELRQNPPKINIDKDATELRIKTVSCMCDNIHYIKLKKNDNNEFRMSGCGNSLSNWQFKNEVYEIEWKADNGNFKEVLEMINSGLSAIESVNYR